MLLLFSICKCALIALNKFSGGVGLSKVILQYISGILPKIQSRLGTNLN